MDIVKRVIKCTDCGRVIFDEVVPREMLERLPKSESCPFCGSSSVSVSCDRFVEVDVK